MHKSIIVFLKPYKYLIISGFAVVSIIALLIITPRPCYNDGFRNLSELQEYAKTIDEFIKMENDNCAFPSYENYYQENYNPSLWQTIQERLTWILCTLGLKRKPFFSSCFFKNILETVTQQRQENGWRGDFIQKIEATPSSQFVVFGPVQGAFHGLVRYLEKLKELDIIDENLKIQNPQYYLIFLGNVVNRSPYTIEILSIVLRLLQQNPYHVIYLKNTHETGTAWKQHTLQRELEIKTKQVSTLEKTIPKFFDTLPLVLYATMPYIERKELNICKFMGQIEDNRLQNQLNETNFQSFLTQKNIYSLDSYDINQKQTAIAATQEISVRAIVKDIKKKELYEEMDGLRLLPPIGGATAWTVLSTSYETARIVMKFFYDAFVIIKAAKTMDKWSIELFNRDIRQSTEKFKQTSFQFFSGKQI